MGAHLYLVGGHPHLLETHLRLDLQTEASRANPATGSTLRTLSRPAPATDADGAACARPDLQPAIQISNGSQAGIVYGTGLLGQYQRLGFIITKLKVGIRPNRAYGLALE